MKDDLAGQLNKREIGQCMTIPCHECIGGHKYEPFSSCPCYECLVKPICKIPRCELRSVRLTFVVNTFNKMKDRDSISTYEELLGLPDAGELITWKYPNDRPI